MWNYQVEDYINGEKCDFDSLEGAESYIMDVSNYQAIQLSEDFTENGYRYYHNPNSTDHSFDERANRLIEALFGVFTPKKATKPVHYTICKMLDFGYDLIEEGR